MRLDDKNYKNGEIVMEEYRNVGEYGILYVLLRHSVKDDEDGDFDAADIERDSYSFLTAIFENGALTDSDYVSDISSERETAEAVFRAVVKGGVTPLTVRDVICDMLSDTELL